MLSGSIGGARPGRSVPAAPLSVGRAPRRDRTPLLLYPHMMNKNLDSSDPRVMDVTNMNPLTLTQTHTAAAPPAPPARAAALVAPLLVRAPHDETLYAFQLSLSDTFAGERAVPLTQSPREPLVATVAGVGPR